MKISIGLSKEKEEDFSGLELAVIKNHNEQDFKGVALATANCTEGNMDGINAGAVNRVEKSASGVLIGAANGVEGQEFRGAEIGFFNYVGGKMRGVLLGGINVLGEDDSPFLLGNKGVFIGGLNVFDDMQGLMVGLVNKRSYSPGYDGETRGISLGALVNLAGDTRGFSFGTLVNAVGDASDKANMKGVSFGGLANYISENMNGVAVSGLINFMEGQEAKGFRFGGLANFSPDMIGMSSAGVFNLGYSLKGLGLSAGINILRDNLYGVLIGAVNYIDGDQFEKSKGVVVSGLGNRIKGPFEGVSFGAVNYCESLRGLQLGLVNICGEDSKGAQLGIFNYRDSGPWYSRLFPGIAVRRGKPKKPQVL